LSGRPPSLRLTCLRKESLLVSQLVSSETASLNKIARLIRGPYTAQLLSLGGSAALTFFSALFLKPDDRGLVAVFLALVSVGGYIACFGVQSEILQSAARGEGAFGDTIIRRHIIVQVAFAGVLGAALVVFKPFQGMSDVLCYWAAAGVLSASIFNNLSWRQYGEGHFFLSTALRGVVPLATLCVSYGFYLFSGSSAENVAITYVLLQAICLAIIVPRDIFSRVREDVRMRQIYIKAAAYFFCQTESLILARTPVIGSGIWLSPDITAAISISLSLTELQSSLPQMRSAISFKEASTSGKSRLSFRQFKSAILALLPGTVAVVILSFVARLFLDAAYSQLPIYVGILSLGVAFQAIAASAINILTTRRSLDAVIGILLVVILAAAGGLYLFEYGVIVGALAVWSIVVALGCFVIILLAMRRKKGRHL
jgi:O-antigen/teichoic acid export membrane protein